MSIKKLFGNKIEQNCEYCANSKNENSVIYCKKYRHAERTKKCKHFLYDPFKRIPKEEPIISKFDPSDFIL